MPHFYVYILTNASRTLYIGVTNNLERRMSEDKQKTVAGFTARYNISQLAYYETYSDAKQAIAREKQLKGWLRAKKIELIETENPNWRDLSAAWQLEKEVCE